MTENKVYERPAITVLQLEEGCCLLAGSEHGKNWTLDGTDFPDVTPNPPKEENPDEIDAKKNTPWGWNDSWDE